MTTAYAYAFGSDFVHPRSRRARIARIDALATLLDTALVIPGTGVRFGLDALIGLFPPSATSSPRRCRCSSCTRPTSWARRATSSYACSATSPSMVFGAVPLVGDAFDVLWRANRRNMRLLREWLEREERRF